MHPLLRSLLDNLWHGVRFAFFVPRRDRPFAASWHAFWFICILTGAITCLSDYIFTEAPQKFYMGGLAQSFTYMVSILVAAYLIGLLFGEKDKTLTQKMLTIAVATYNASFPVYIVLVAIYLLPAVQSDHGTFRESIYNIRWAWLYLVSFQIMALNFKQQPVRQLLAALILITAWCAPAYGIQLHYWYNDSGTEDDDTGGENVSGINGEDLLQAQHALLQDRLKNLKPSKTGKPAMYGVVFGSTAWQDVFMKEAKYVNDTLVKKFDMSGGTVVMINNRQTINDYPLAIVSNLAETLKHIGSISQKDKDVLLLYLTSHGGQTTGLSIQMDDVYGLHRGLTGKRLAQLLKESGIRNRIIIISSCYSGSMIDDLKTPDTLIMTAAAKDRTSFGCSNEAELTYFADAYFKTALSKTNNFIDAFYIAKKSIEEREIREDIKVASNPQIFIGENIKAFLAKRKETVEKKE